MRKRIKKIARNCGILIVVIILLPSIYRFACGIGMEKVYDGNGLSVYMDNKRYKKQIDSIVTLVNLRLRTAIPDYQPKSSVYFCGTLSEFHIKALLLTTPLAVNRPNLSAILVRPCKFDKGVVETISKALYTRTISDILVHEITHHYEYQKLSFFQFYLKDYKESWKVEGFADYIAGSSSFPVEKGLRIFLGDDSYDFVTSNEVEPEYFYFVSRLRTDYLLRYKSIGEDEYWSTKYDEEQLDAEIKREIRKGYTISQGNVIEGENFRLND